ncbi:hypothetical protein C5S31_08555 [ANME-1 cluster archaeon GoMg2]|nr:hypothetical protein [ANME-1 cluster archaeon GoMg2]
MNRNRWVHGLSAIVLLSVLVMAMPVSAQDPTAESFGVDNASGAHGTSVIVPVNITNVSNGPIRCIVFNVAYNKTVINVTDVSRGNATSTWGELKKNNSFAWGTSVSLYGDAADGAVYIQNGTSDSVALLNFSVVGTRGEMTNMNFTYVNISFSDISGYKEGSAPPKNGTFTVSGTQSWYLHNDSEMYKGNQTNPQGNITINHSDFHIWIADSPAQTDVTFPVNGNNWTGLITFVSAPADGDTFTVEIGNSTGGTDFTPGGPQATLTGNGSKSVFSFETTAAAFTVPAGKFLALNVTNDNTSFDYKVQTGMAWSYVSSPGTDPGYPIPEWCTMTLVSVGLLMLTGYLWLRKKK